MPKQPMDLTSMEDDNSIVGHLLTQSISASYSLFRIWASEFYFPKSLARTHLRPSSNSLFWHRFLTEK